MTRTTLAALLVLTTAAALLAQETPAPAPLPAAPRLITVEAPGAAMLSFRSRGKASIELTGTAQASSGFGQADVERKTGFTEIKINRGDIQGLPIPSSFGRDYLTYVLWAVPESGDPLNLGEVSFRDGRSEELKVTVAYQTFWLLVTAEPDFAVHQPSPVAVLASRSEDRSGNKSFAVPSTLVYYTSFTSYDTSSAGELSPGMPEWIRQARHAVDLADRNETLARQLAAEEPEELTQARRLLQLAHTYLDHTETLLGSQQDSQEVATYARATTQLAEAARAVASGAAGGLPVQRLRAEVEKLRAANAQAQQELTSLQDRLSQLEASLDQERRRTRDLETQQMALREQMNLLQGSVEAAQQQAAGMKGERSQLCEELRRQLASLGQLTEQDGQLMLTLSSDVLFEYNRYTLNPAARENLARLAVLRLVLFPGAEVHYEGHTDLSGDADYNQWLSEQRALAVYRFFLQEQLSHAQIPDERAELEERSQAVEQLLGQNFNTARRQSDQRQQLLDRLGGVVVGKGMREPLVPVQGANEQNRRVTLIFPSGSVGGPGAFCPSAAATE